MQSSKIFRLLKMCVITHKMHRLSTHGWVKHQQCFIHNIMDGKSNLIHVRYFDSSLYENYLSLHISKNDTQFKFAMQILFSIHCVINTSFPIYYVITTLTITISCNIRKCNGAWLFASCMIAAATAYNYIEWDLFSITFSFSLKVSSIHFRGSFFFLVYKEHLPFFFF